MSWEWGGVLMKSRRGEGLGGGCRAGRAGRGDGESQLGLGGGEGSAMRSGARC